MQKDHFAAKGDEGRWQGTFQWFRFGLCTAFLIDSSGQRGEGERERGEEGKKERGDGYVYL